MADRSDHVYEKVESFKPVPLQSALATMQALPPKMAVDSGWQARRMQSSASLHQGLSEAMLVEEGQAKQSQTHRKPRWNPFKALWRMLPSCRASTCYFLLVLLLFIAMFAVFITVPVEFLSAEWCGNGVVEAGEACDDGNFDETDGCSSSCTILAGFTCFADAVTLRNSACQLCSQDTFSPEQQRSQLPLETGAAQTLTGRAALNTCRQCPANTTTVHPLVANWQELSVGREERTACVCMPGHSGPNGGPCLACTGATYKPRTGNANCTFCPPHSISPPGSVRPAQCQCLAGFELSDQGFWAIQETPGGENISSSAVSASSPPPSLSLDVANFSCVACAPGFFKPDVASAPCTPCPPGSFSNGTGATGCVLCAENTFMPSYAASACVSCPSPFQVSGNGSTSVAACQCTAGTSGVDGACECALCEAGTFRNEIAPTRCTPCAAGHYANASGALTCVPCPPGSYQDELGQAVCKPCPSNHSSSLAGASSPAQCFCVPGFLDYPPYACTACKVGFARPRLNQTSCEECSAGSFAASGQAECTLCVGGYQNMTAQSACYSCPLPQHATVPGDRSPVSPASCKCKEGFQPIAGGRMFVGFEGGHVVVGNSSIRGVMVESCELCAPGTVKGLVGDENCSACGIGEYMPWEGRTACAVCSDGRTTLTTGSSRATDCVCDRGHAGLGCQPCPLGQYKGSVGGVACDACAADETTRSVGSTSVLNCTCSPGFTQIGSSCARCPAGHFKDWPGPEACTPCPPGSFASTTGGATACTRCASGSYTTSNGSSSCLRCPDTHQISLDAAKSPTDGAVTADSCWCGLGYYGPRAYDPGECMACAPGKFNDGVGELDERSACVSCAGGTYAPLDGATACVACPNGTFSLGEAATTCAACQPGWISVQDDKTSCEPCPAGTFSELPSAANTSMQVERVSPAFPFRLATFTTFMDVGSIKCLDCTPGKYSTAGSTACVDCARGTFSDVYAASVCTPCPPNEFQGFAGQTACAACPSPSYTSPSGQTVQVRTVTLDVGNFDGGSCVCPEGYYGHADGLTCVPCDPGTFKDRPGRQACGACPAGTAMNETGASVCTDCAPGTVTQTTWDRAGGWTGGQGLVECASCPAAMTTLRAGSRAITECVCEAGWVGGWEEVAEGAGFNGSTLQPLCLPCFAGTTQRAGAGDTQESCITCQAGTFAAGFGSPRCEECPIGAFQNQSGSSFCNSCPALHVTAAPAAVSASDCECPVGFESDPASPGTCRPCQPGSSNAVVGGLCLSCARGSFTNETAATSCSLCGGQRAEGQNRSTFQPNEGATACEACADAMQESALGAASEDECWCPPGWEGSLSGGLLGECRECDPGSIKPPGRGGGCEVCAVGKFMETRGETACDACPQGTSTRTTGASAAAHCQCVPGLERGEGGECVRCGAGTYKESVGNEACSRCPGFSNATAAGSDAVESCLCLPGFFGTAETGCEPCPAGTFASGLGSAECLPCPQGFFSPGMAASACFQCLPGTFNDRSGAARCQDCRIDSSVPFHAATACQDCAIGLVAPVTGQANCTPACLALGSWWA